MFGQFHHSLESIKDKTDFILERMQRSNGFSNLHKKLSRPHSGKLSLASTQRISLLSTSISKDILKTEPSTVELRSKFHDFIDGK